MRFLTIRTSMKIGLARAWFAMLLLGLGATIARADLIAYWKLDETSGTIAHDSVGGFNGTLTGSAVFAPGMGIINGAVSLTHSTNTLVNMGDVLMLSGD